MTKRNVISAVAAALEAHRDEPPEVAARAVIAAMRKPSTAMLRAACGAMSPGKRPTQKRVSVRAKHGIRYMAMIDAALSLGDKQ